MRSASGGRAIQPFGKMAGSVNMWKKLHRIGKKNTTSSVAFPSQKSQL